MRCLLCALALIGMAAACTGSDDSTSITLVTHDSFAVSESVLAGFEEQTGIEVQVLKAGDAGTVVNQAILTKDDPLGDVLFGIDTTFLSRVLDEGILVPYESPELASVPAELQLDPEHRATPVDYGDVCVNYDKAALAARSLTPPETLDDLAAARYRDLLVVENPATSSPGLAFLLATVDRYGADGWISYWEQLRVNGVEVVDDWEVAFNESFSGGGGSGERPLVVSYASSPPATIVFSDPPPDEPTIGTALGTCFRQVELVGILDGTDDEPEARALVDFMLSKTFQEDVPLSMFVFPVRADATLPAVFVEHADVPDAPFSLPPDEIAANREQWIDQWRATVLQ